MWQKKFFESLIDLLAIAIIKKYGIKKPS